MQKNANADWVHVRMKMMDLKAPHSAPLVAYADEVAAGLGLEPGAVPYPDPEHGGTEAEVLFVLSHPGATAIRAHGGSGMLSMENNDPPSVHCLEQCERVGLDVGRVTHWNAVPQMMPLRTAPTPTQVRAGSKWLPGLLELLPRLQVVVLLGRNAELAWDTVAPEREVTVVRGPSPGRQGMANRAAPNLLSEAFDEIASHLGLQVSAGA